MADLQFKISAASQRPQRVRMAAGATLGELKARINDLFGIPKDLQVLLAGFPPSAIAESADSASLLQVFPSGREAITVQQREACVEPASKTEGPPAGEQLNIVKVPSDNSCLFACVAQAFGLAHPSDEFYRDTLHSLRMVVSSTIMRNSELYSEAVLDRSASDYCAWIEDSKSWGGEIEMSILANHFNVTIAAVAIEDGQVYSYSGGIGTERTEGFEFRSRQLTEDDHPFCILIYDGIHYDYAAVGDSGTFFGSWADHEALQNVRRIAEQLRREKAFVNTNSFVLVCNQCGLELIGQDATTAHAQATGHTNFRQR